jgi:SAM-dependent methyltransferase
MWYEDGDAWAAGPDRVYGLLAAAAVDLIPDDLTGRVALDAGAGTGAAGRALAARGATVVSVDASASMVRRADGVRLVGSVARLPLRDGSVDAAIASLVLSHVDDPVGALGELRRVTRAGGVICATAFPYGVGHRVKEIADQVLAEAGYQPPEWYTTLKTSGERRVGTAADLVALAAAAGLRQPQVHVCDVDLTGLPVDALVAWRLGMAPVAAWLSAQVSPEAQGGIAAQIAARVDVPGPLALLVLIARSA